MQIPVGILSVNIKMSLWPFDGREASLNNLVPGRTWDREKLVCFSECLLIITEGIFFQYFEKQVHFCFYLIHFHFPAYFLGKIKLLFAEKPVVWSNGTVVFD